MSKVETWIHKKIILSPDNKEFKDIVLENVREDEFHVAAEFVKVISDNNNDPQGTF